MIILHLTFTGGQPQHAFCNCTTANSLLKGTFYSLNIFSIYFYSTLTPPTVTLQHKYWPLYLPHNDSTSSYFRDQQVQLTSWMDRNKTVSCRPFKNFLFFFFILLSIRYSVLLPHTHAHLLPWWKVITPNRISASARATSDPASSRRSPPSSHSLHPSCHYETECRGASVTLLI